MSRKSYFILIVFIATMMGSISTSYLRAQDTTRFISLTEALSNSLQNNKSIQLAKIDETIAASKYKQTDAIYLPQVALTYTAMSTNNPLNAFGFKLQQKSISATDFNPTLLNNPAGTPDFNTKLEVLQPIINMDLVYQKKAAAKQTELYQYKTQRTQEYISFEVQKAYLQIALSYDVVMVFEEALSTSKAVVKFTTDHFEQGLIQKSDVLNAKVQLQSVESNLAKAKSNIRNASDYLSLLMGQKTGTIYQISKETIKEIALTTKIEANRADFIAMQKAIEATELAIKANKMSYLPKLNAFGSYQLNDSKILGFGANAYLAGVQVSWDIFKGNRTKNTIATQELERNKLSAELNVQKDESALALSKAFRDLGDAKSEIKQQEMAVELARESLKILQNRYQQGLVNTTDVLMAATQLSQQKLAVAQAIFSADITKAYLTLLTTTGTK